MRIKCLIAAAFALTISGSALLKGADSKDPSASTEKPTTSSRAEDHKSASLASGTMIYQCIRYTIDPAKVADFETYAKRWMEGGLIKRCGGTPLGYFLPKIGYGGPNNIAMTFIGFPSLAAVEDYRKNLASDPEARANVEFIKKSGCILSEDRSYYYRVGDEQR